MLLHAGGYIALRRETRSSKIGVALAILLLFKRSYNCIVTSASILDRRNSLARLVSRRPFRVISWLLNLTVSGQQFRVSRRRSRLPPAYRLPLRRRGHHDN